MPDISNIPAPRVPVVDNNGLMTRQWYRYLFNLFNIAGAGGSAISNTDMLLAPDAVVANPNVLSYGPSYPMGYGNGAGGAVTQSTSRTTDVTINVVCGQITLFAASKGAGTPGYFTFNVLNSTVSASDVVIVNMSSGTADTYIITVTAVSNGSFRVQMFMYAGAPLESPVLNFAVIKSVAV